jgi:hypothetical protein
MSRRPPCRIPSIQRTQGGVADIRHAPPDEPVKKAAATSRPSAPRMESLQALRFVAQMQIVAFHFYGNTDSPALNNFNGWGSTGLTFFFVLSGKGHAGSSPSQGRHAGESLAGVFGTIGARVRAGTTR